MICLKIKKYIVASHVLATIFSVNCNAQTAENLFHKKYSKLSLVLQPSWIMPNNYNNGYINNYPSVNFTKAFSYQFGLTYNFAQSGSFNFKTGIIAKEFSPVFDLNISDDDIGYGVDYTLTEYNPFNQFIISIPFKTEYFLKVNPKLNLVFGAGLGLNLFTGIDEKINVFLYVNNNIDEKLIFLAETTNQKKITLNTEASIGFNYESKFALLQLELFSNGGFSTSFAVEGKYEIINLVNSPNTKGGFLISDRYNGLSLTISPKKGWLKKKE
ncbi:hypothetical protein [Flavobacterium sp.]|uniref:hypothetical protein n=1 Tax=Flavobacterium sp. TaxID=239 RepID=UPI003750FDBA